MALTEACFWRDPILVESFDVLVELGEVQARAATRGYDSPAGFFVVASIMFAGDLVELGRLACDHAAARFASEAAS